jgi:2-polyprenyl-3-methyl-5-hydroxy-6-metoxy-1,4-benzoquinol methylase
MLLHTNLVDRLFSAPGAWSLRRCPNAACGLTWLDPEPVAADLADLYVGYYTHRLTVGKWGTIRRALQRAFSATLHLTRIAGERRMLLNLYLENTPPGRVLEVGCGAGERLSRFRALGWNVMGQEVDETAAAGAEKRTGAHVHVGPVEELVAEGQSFDAVVMNHVIEHVLDPVSLLASCRRLLKPGGQLICVTPNTDSWGYRRFGKDWLFLDPPRHIVLFTRAALEATARKAAFRTLSVWSSCANAQVIAEGSLQIAARGRHDMTRWPGLRVAFTAFLLQFDALAKFRSCQESGDELVLRCIP